MAGRTDPEKVNNTDFNGGVNYIAQRTMVSDREMDKLVEGVLYAQKKAQEALDSAQSKQSALEAGDNITINYKEDGTAVISSTANNAYIDLAKLIDGSAVSMSKLNEAIRQAYNAKDPACARVNIYISSDQPLSVNISAIQLISNCNYYFNAVSDSVTYTMNTDGLSIDGLSNCDFYGLDISNCRIAFNGCKNIQFFNCEFVGNILSSTISFVNCSDVYMDNCQFRGNRTALQIQSATTGGFEWIMFENCIFHLDSNVQALDAYSAVNPKEIITFANCYYSDMTLVTKDYVNYNASGARINVALYEITSLTAGEVSEIFNNA